MRNKKILGWVIAGVCVFLGLFMLVNIGNLKSGVETIKTDISTMSNYNLSISTTDKATVAVTDADGEAVVAGVNKLVKDAVYTVTVTPTSGYTATITVNGITFTSGNSFTANGNIAIVVETAVSAS